MAYFHLPSRIEVCTSYVPTIPFMTRPFMMTPSDSDGDNQSQSLRSRFVFSRCCCPSLLLLGAIVGRVEQHGLAERGGKMDVNQIPDWTVRCLRL